MRSFAETRGLHSLRDFDLDVLETFQAEWHEGAVASLKKLERVKAFFRAALIRRWIEDNPTAAMRGPKLRARPTLPFTREEMASILAAHRAAHKKQDFLIHAKDRCTCLLRLARACCACYRNRTSAEREVFFLDRQIYSPHRNWDMAAKSAKTLQTGWRFPGVCTSISRHVRSRTLTCRRAH
jgi:hypothetical protein